MLTDSLVQTPAIKDFYVVHSHLRIFALIKNQFIQKEKKNSKKFKKTKTKKSIMRLFTANAIEWVLVGVNIERRQPDIIYLSTPLICSVNQVKSQFVEASAWQKKWTLLIGILNRCYIIKLTQKKKFFDFNKELLLQIVFFRAYLQIILSLRSF